MNLNEYKKKVEDIYGKEGELDVVKSIAGDKYDEDEVEGEGEEWERGKREESKS